VNQDTAGQFIPFNLPDIAATPNGDFVVVWAAYAFDYSTYRYRSGVFGRKFTVCGDGRLGPLDCDDGNSTSLDGCSPHCQIETCRTCSGEPSTCGTLPSCAAVCSDAAAIDDKAILT